MKFKIGDKVEHIKDPGFEGIIIAINYDKSSEKNSTCKISWLDFDDFIQTVLIDDLVKVENSINGY